MSASPKSTETKPRPDREMSEFDESASEEARDALSFTEENIDALFEAAQDEQNENERHVAKKMRAISARFEKTQGTVDESAREKLKETTSETQDKIEQRAKEADKDAAGVLLEIDNVGDKEIDSIFESITVDPESAEESKKAEEESRVSQLLKEVGTELAKEDELSIVTPGEFVEPLTVDVVKRQMDELSNEDAGSSVSGALMKKMSSLIKIRQRLESGKYDAESNEVHETVESISHTEEKVFDVLQRLARETNDIERYDKTNENIRQRTQMKELQISASKSIEAGLNRTLMVGMGESEDKVSRLAVYKGGVAEQSVNPEVHPNEPGETFKKEWLASVLDNVFDLNVVPQTVIREDGPDGIGSMQQKEPGEPAIKFENWQEAADQAELAKTAFLDDIIGNTDRNIENILITDNGKVVAIDNALAFPDAGKPGQRLASVANEVMSGYKIPDSTNQRVEQFFKSNELQSVVQEAFDVALGEDGQQRYQEFVNKLEKYREDQPIPDTKRSLL